MHSNFQFVNHSWYKNGNSECFLPSKQIPFRLLCFWPHCWLSLESMNNSMFSFLLDQRPHHNFSWLLFQRCFQRVKDKGKGEIEWDRAPNQLFLIANKRWRSVRLPHYYIKRSQRHLLAAVENNWLEAPIRIDNNCQSLYVQRCQSAIP